jgi:hypothetical protein
MQSKIATLFSAAERNKMTDTAIELDTYTDEYKTQIMQLIAEYGDASSVPHDEQFFASEKLRAAYCVHANPSIPVQQVLRQYAIDARVWDYFVDNATEMKAERRMSRVEKVNSVLAWASNNVSKQITLQDLIHETDIAYSMAKKITEDRPDVFRKIKRGLFEIRDPKADRDAEKTSAGANK